ncbi:hypothetical protein RRF57_003961 [Xylaria bambusicola]|uniref:C2 domain-containing protein n=1 Tax=Xylaria bambusicola TaxID=326684 RepID=A0AAN7UL66_9PEZI
MAEINSLRRASPTDDDADQIGYDTPRSGIATPQPDLKDKRLPGIMSYFGQVRSTPSASFFSFRPFSQAGVTETPCPTSPQEEKESEKNIEQTPTSGGAASKDRELITSTPPSHQRTESLGPEQHLQRETPFFYPYPTPPCSKTPSERGQKLSDASADSGRESSISPPKRPSPSLTMTSSSGRLAQKIRRATLASPVTSIVTTHSVPKSSALGPSGCSVASTTSCSPFEPELPSDDRVTSLSDQRDMVDTLRKLTLTTSTKSGPSTPTRALSGTQPSAAEDRSLSQASRTGTDSNGRQSNSPSSGGDMQAPTQRGKLTIKIREGRGLRKSRDPYVVAVFQRSELISPGPRTFEDDDEPAAPPSSVQMGGIPISRQGSDSGRPMAIPMRSRQSSNTSISDYTAFRNRTRKSFTSPKWDAEAVFDVVDSDMLVDISVYDHGVTGEEFLGHVDFQAIAPGTDEPVRGWFPLRANFKGFTFVDESALEDNMKDRFGDAEMSDNDALSDTDHRDNDWDDLEDLGLGKGNRMSGIVKNGHQTDGPFQQFDL